MTSPPRYFYWQETNLVDQTFHRVAGHALRSHRRVSDQDTLPYAVIRTLPPRTTSVASRIAASFECLESFLQKVLASNRHNGFLRNAPAGGLLFDERHADLPPSVHRDLRSRCALLCFARLGVPNRRTDDALTIR